MGRFRDKEVRDKEVRDILFGTFRIAGHFGVKEVRDILFGTFRIGGHFGVKEELDVGNIFGMLRGLRSLDI